jgi:hypothetical protein
MATLPKAALTVEGSAVSGGYGHVTVRPAMLDRDGQVMWTQRTDGQSPAWVFSCQTGSTFGDGDGDGPETYCWRLRADECDTLEQAEATVKAMRKLRKTYEASVEAYGGPANFAQFVAWHFPPRVTAHLYMPPPAPPSPVVMPLRQALDSVTLAVVRITRKSRGQ